MPGATAMRKVIPLDVVETIREGLLVLEPDLTINFANRSFCQHLQSRHRIPSGGSFLSSETGSGTFPSCALALRPSSLAETPSRHSKSTSSSRQWAGA
jgi:hypothetical protein